MDTSLHDLLTLCPEYDTPSFHFFDYSSGLHLPCTVLCDVRQPQLYSDCEHFCPDVFKCIMDSNLILTTSSSTVLQISIHSLHRSTSTKSSYTTLVTVIVVAILVLLASIVTLFTLGFKGRITMKFHREMSSSYPAESIPLQVLRDAENEPTSEQSLNSGSLRIQEPYPDEQCKQHDPNPEHDAHTSVDINVHSGRQAQSTRWAEHPEHTIAPNTSTPSDHSTQADVHNNSQLVYIPQSHTRQTFRDESSQTMDGEITIPKVLGRTEHSLSCETHAHCQDCRTDHIEQPHSAESSNPHLPNEGIRVPIQISDHAQSDIHTNRSSTVEHQEYSDDNGIVLSGEIEITRMA